jgi:hypothetical protein
MKKIAIEPDGPSPDCPVCGNSPLADDKVIPCEHLLFVDSNAGDEPWYISSELDFSVLDDSDDPPTHLEVLESLYPGDEVLLYVLGSPVPFDLAIHVVYRTGE